jgi:hypothetical protein
VSAIRILALDHSGRSMTFYIEREWLSGPIGRLLWEIDVRSFYASIQAVGRLDGGATVLDAPCDGGVALRALRPDVAPG